MSISSKGFRRTGRHNRATGSYSDHSKRPPSKSRHTQGDSANIANAKRNYERYMTLTRSAASTSDAIEIENFYQHAEHNLRLMRKQAV